MIDRCTSWPEAVPVADITAETVARVIYEGWIVRFGCPLRITTDQGRQFESRTFECLTQLLGVQRIRTTAYHPQANSKVERLHRTIKASLMARGSRDWVRELPSVLMGIRSAVRDDTGFSATEMLYGAPVKLPGDFFTGGESSETYDELVRRIRSNISMYAAVPTRRCTSQKIYVHPELGRCSHVFVRCDILRPNLTPPYEGPYLVVSRTDKVFCIQKGGKESYVSIDRLKPAFLLAGPDADHADSADARHIDHSAVKLLQAKFFLRREPKPRGPSIDSSSAKFSITRRHRQRSPLSPAAFTLTATAAPPPPRTDSMGIHSSKDQINYNSDNGLQQQEMDEIKIAT
ncbi:uncharacterized protein LOC134747439 [Cydia strobilella]|uniref:uncharacterized protein LOC134747439 n=1 Tax=Cydia strobilella TaxID=1100964 RepID=UPI003005046B